MPDPLAALEAWANGHKSRAVEVSRSTGYAATCWVVKLWGHGKTVEAAEVSFWRVPKDKPVLPEYVFVVPPEVEGDDSDPPDWDWPGLGPTILAALKRADELGL
jgi:hypothetical protein